MAMYCRLWQFLNHDKQVLYFRTCGLYVASILVQYLNDTKYGKIPKGFKHCTTNSITMVIYIFIRKVYAESKQRIYQLQVQNGSINHNIKIHHAATYVTVFVTTSMLV